MGTVVRFRYDTIWEISVFAIIQMLTERFPPLCKLYLLPLVKTSWVEGKEFKCPNCFPFFGQIRVRAGFQHCNFNKILGILILMTGDKMVSHMAQVSTHLVVRFVIGPPLTHWLVIGCGGGSHSHIMSPSALWPSWGTGQMVHNCRSTGTWDRARNRKFESWHRRRLNKSSKRGNFTHHTSATSIKISRSLVELRIRQEFVLIRGTQKSGEVWKLPVRHHYWGRGDENV